MHLHAMHVKGSTPARVGAPFDILGLHDPKDPYIEMYQKALIAGSWSVRQFIATTNTDSLKLLTLEALRANNVYAVTSGNIGTIREWKKALPGRIINAIDWNFFTWSDPKLVPDLYMLDWQVFFLSVFLHDSSGLWRQPK